MPDFILLSSCSHYCYFFCFKKTFHFIILSAILFNSGKNNKKSKADSKKAGDININGELIEVKAEISKLQNTAAEDNYEKGLTVITKKFAELSELIAAAAKPKDLIDKVIEPSPDERIKQIDEANEPIEIKLSELINEANSLGFKNFNINNEKLNDSWLKLKKLAIENGLTDTEFARWFVSLFYTVKLFTKKGEKVQSGIWKNDSYYGDKDVNQLIEQTEAYFKNDTITEDASQSFLNTLGWHSLLYYQKCDKFKKLLYADIVNNSIIIYDPRSGIGEFLKKFKIMNGPTWKDGGTNSCFKLKSI